MSNAGTWLVGRLQTENDKARVLEGLKSAAGGTDLAALDAAIGGLDKRQFLLVSARASQPALFTSRWAMSYLRGPLTKDQISTLMSETPRTPAPTVPAPEISEPPIEESVDATPVAPPVAAGFATVYADPAAPWAAKVGGVAEGSHLRAFLAATVDVRFDDTGAAVDERQEYEALYGPLDVGVDLSQPTAVDYDDRDFVADPPPTASYVLPTAPIGEASFFRSAEREIKRHLTQSSTLELLRNRQLKLVSRPGETPEQFAERCDQAARASADEQAAKIRDRLEARQERLEAALEQAQRRVEELTTDERSRQASELVAGAGAVLGALLGGRRSTRSMASAISGAASRRGVSTRTAARKQTAETKSARIADDLRELEQEILDEVQEIDEKWRQMASEIETVTIRPEASDVRVHRLAVVWVTTA
jgi:hypothetical protein